MNNPQMTGDPQSRSSAAVKIMGESMPVNRTPYIVGDREFSIGPATVDAFLTVSDVVVDYFEGLETSGLLAVVIEAWESMGFNDRADLATELGSESENPADDDSAALPALLADAPTYMVRIDIDSPDADPDRGTNTRSVPNPGAITRKAIPAIRKMWKSTPAAVDKLLAVIFSAEQPGDGEYIRRHLSIYDLPHVVELWLACNPWEDLVEHFFDLRQTIRKKIDAMRGDREAINTSPTS